MAKAPPPRSSKVNHKPPPIMRERPRTHPAVTVYFGGALIILALGVIWWFLF